MVFGAAIIGLCAGATAVAAGRWPGRAARVAIVVVVWCLAIALTVLVTALRDRPDTGYPPGVGVQGEDTDRSRQLVVAGFWGAPVGTGIGLALGRRRRP